MTSLVFTAPEGSSAVLTGVLQDEDGNALAGSAVDQLTAYLTDEETGTVINGRYAQDILGTNGGTLDAEGNLRLQLVAADNPFLGSRTELRHQMEIHVLRIDWEWGETGSGRARVRIAVEAA